MIVIETNYADFTLHHVFNDIFSIMSTLDIYRKKPHENEMLFVDWGIIAHDKWGYIKL